MISRPGRSCPMASMAPTSAFSSVDLPTFGRPTMAAYPARWAILGGCPSSHGGCGERSGGCERRARSSLLRRAFRHASSVVAALAALAPRLVRLAHHDYSDGLLGFGSQPPGFGIRGAAQRAAEPVFDRRTLGEEVRPHGARPAHGERRAAQAGEPDLMRR